MEQFMCGASHKPRIVEDFAATAAAADAMELEINRLLSIRICVWLPSSVYSIRLCVSVGMCWHYVIILFQAISLYLNVWIHMHTLTRNTRHMCGSW